MDLYKKTEYMKLALKLAQEVKGSTSPNPAVGAIIIKNNTIIGSGATSPAGGPHGEIMAINSVKEYSDLKDSHIFVTLEPCSHFGKTPPCANAIIDAKISKVTIAILDPNPLVSGKGVELLKNSGIEVDIGICSKEATELNEDFLFYITNKKPWITLKLALTLDGRVADTNGKSKWITNSKSREFVHKLRSSNSAIAVGHNTLNEDNPSLTARTENGKNPIRIIFSSNNKIDKNSYFYQNREEVRSIVVIGNDENSRIETRDSIEYWYCGTSNKTDMIKRFVDMAGEEKIDSLFVEGGATLASSFIEADLVNRYYIFYGPKIIGNGKMGISLKGGFPMSNPINLINTKTETFGDNIMITGISNRGGCK